MRIAVVSDTHLPRFGRSLPAPLVEGIHAANVDLIVHLGDWTSLLAVEVLEALGPLDGVAGNNDPPEIVERFGRAKVIEVAGARIGLTHGDLGPGRTTPERAVRTFGGPGENEPSHGEPPQVVLFGHSHIPLIRRFGADRLLLNPGSPTDKRRQPGYSWALLEIRDGRADAELRSFERR
jgi:putative phosphoesterase